MGRERVGWGEGIRWGGLKKKIIERIYEQRRKKGLASKGKDNYFSQIQEWFFLPSKGVSSRDLGKSYPSFVSPENKFSIVEFRC